MKNALTGTFRALSISFLLHALLFVLLAWMSSSAQRSTPKPQALSKPLQLNLKRSPSSLLQAPPVVPAQIVDSNDTKNIVKSPPKDAKYLSDQNRQVQKETQARTHSNSTQNQQAPSKSVQAPQEKNFQGIGSQKPNLKLSESFLQSDQQKTALSAGSPSNYLPNMDMGNETLLNTKEYAFASYFVRMKRQMEAIWNPQGILATSKLDREVYLTSVSILMDGNGKVLEVYILEPSGDLRLDQEAIRTVRDSGPYFNPPKALIEDDGNIRVPKWSFIVTRHRGF